jgi:hypothetical protein
VAILTNRQLTAPPYWILYGILDLYLGSEPTDWSARFRELVGQFEARPEFDQVSETRASLPLDRYVGTYESATLGQVVVERLDDGLHLRYGVLTGPLKHWHFDTFRLPWSDAAWLASAGPGWVTFHIGRDAAVGRLELEVLPGETWELDRVRATETSRPDG